MPRRLATGFTSCGTRIVSPLCSASFSLVEHVSHLGPALRIHGARGKERVGEAGGRPIFAGRTEGFARSKPSRTVTSNPPGLNRKPTAPTPASVAPDKSRWTLRRRWILRAAIFSRRDFGGKSVLKTYPIRGIETVWTFAAAWFDLA